jgi:hypothetical protein
MRRRRCSTTRGTACSPPPALPPPPRTTTTTRNDAGMRPGEVRLVVENGAPLDLRYFDGGSNSTVHDRNSQMVLENDPSVEDSLRLF